MTSNEQPTPKYLGVKGSDFDGFDTFPAPFEQVSLDTDVNVLTVAIRGDEFTAICPVTGQPDYYEIDIDYTPRDRCVESKSLKLYLQQFRNHGEYVESLCNRINDDLVAALDPLSCRVSLTQSSRGGLSITASTYYVREGASR